MKEPTEFFIGMQSMFRLYDRMLKKVCVRYDLTLIEADIISFLKYNPSRDTAVDIVELRMLSKGTVSKAVEALVRRSFLERIPDENDRRKIHLHLLMGADPVVKEICEVREAFFDIVLKGFSEEELEAEWYFLQRQFDNTMRAIEGREQP